MAPRPFRDHLRELVQTEARPLHKFGHQPRLQALCQQVGEALAYDEDVVFAAVWLHDLGVFEGNRPESPEQLARWDHVRYVVDRAPALLRQTDFPAEKIPHVLAVIREHQPRDTPSSLEATIVRDADILEQLGAITILRTAAKLGSDTRFLGFTDVRNALARQLADLPSRLQLPRSRELAAPRITTLQAFLTSLAAEAGDHLD